jgi:hypothetical protein
MRADYISAHKTTCNRTVKRRRHIKMDSFGRDLRPLQPCRHLDSKQPGRVAAENQPPLGVAELP